MGQKYGQLTDLGFLQLYEKGQALKQYLTSENLISARSQDDESSQDPSQELQQYRFITSPTQRVQESFYSFIQGFNSEEPQSAADSVDVATLRVNAQLYQALNDDP